MPSAVKKAPIKSKKRVRVLKKVPVLPKSKVNCQDEFMSGSNLAQVSASINALLEVISQKKSQLKKNSLFKDEPQEIILQVNAIKIPLMKTKLIRIALPYTTAIENSDICLITTNVKKSSKENHEPTINHFKNFLETKKIKSITQIVPIRQLESEYGTYEMKGRFADLYDRVLVDNRLHGRVAKFLGSRFFKKNKVLIPVKLNTMKFKERVERALKLASLTVHGKGDSFSVKVGFSHFSKEQIKENICAIVQGLSSEFPGGFNNIRKLLIKSERSMAIPIYVSLRSSNSVKVPVVQEHLPKAYAPVEGELTTFPGGYVKVMPTGEVTFRKKYVQEDVDLGFARSTSQRVGLEYESYLDEAEDELEYANQEDEDDEEEEDEGEDAVETKQMEKKKNVKSKTKNADESSDDDVEAAEDAYLEDLELEMVHANVKKVRDKNVPKLQQKKRNKRSKKSAGEQTEIEIGQSKKQAKALEDKPAQKLGTELVTTKQIKQKLSEDGEMVENTPKKQRKRPRRSKNKQSKEIVTESAEPKGKKMKLNSEIGEATSPNLSHNKGVSPVVKDKATKKHMNQLKMQKIKNKEKNEIMNSEDSKKKKMKKSKLSISSQDKNASTSSHNLSISPEKQHTIKPKFDRYFSPKNKIE